MARLPVSSIRSRFVTARAFCFLFVLTGALSLHVRQAQAQDVSVSAFVDATTVGENDRVVFTLQVDGATNGVRTPEPPATEGLTLVSPFPSTMHQTSIVNGAVSQSVTFQWSFRPLRQGRARIFPMTVTVGQHDFKTEAIDLTVVPSSQQPSAGRSPDAGDQLTSQDLFIKVVPSTRTAYPNQQIVLVYHLYFRYGIELRQSRLADSWDADGFWREDLEVDDHPRARMVTENGIRYNTIVVKRVALFPTRTGKLRVEPLRIETEAFSPYSADPLDRFFSLGRGFETVKIASAPVTVDVKPLPPGAPPSFKGAVGTFRMETHTGRTDLKVGDALEVTATISGSGNLATLPAPVLDAPGAFEAYDPQVTTSINRKGARVAGSRTFSYVLVPRTNGQFDLPPLAFSFLDPESGAYETLTSAPVMVAVSGTAAEPGAGAAASGMPVNDIAGPMAVSASWIRADDVPLYRNPWTYGALACPLLAVGAAFAFRRRRDRLSGDQGRGPVWGRPLVHRHLKKAAALARAGEARAFYEEIERAVLGFIGNRLKIPERGLTHRHLDDVLADAGASPAVRSELSRLLNECDRARFAPVPADTSEMQTAVKRAEEIIAAIDRLASPSDTAYAA
ncbi:MAG TPA: BatD family protein [Rhodothermales bacterium]|nr:BatD family protein [Rhodothermales bacterium]